MGGRSAAVLFCTGAVVPVRHADSLSLRRKAQRMHKDAKDAS